MGASEFRLYHVAGPAVLQAQVGAAFAWATVGVAEDGIDLTFRTFRREIKPDGAGGPEGAPANFLFLNQTLTARCVLVPYAGVYVNRLRSLSQATFNDTDGVMPQSGTLYGFSGGYLNGIRFSSSDPDGGWWLRTCQVSMPGDFKASPNVSKPVMEFTAINWYNPSSVATILGNVLYSKI